METEDKVTLTLSSSLTLLISFFLCLKMRIIAFMMMEEREIVTYVRA